MVTRLPVPPTKLETLIGTLPWLLLAALIVFAIVRYPDMPSQVPTHFDALGAADAMGGKSFIWILLGVFVLLEFGMSILIRYPSAFNFPVNVNASNRAALVRYGMKLMRAMKLSVAILAWLVVATVLGYVGGPWILPVTLVFVFLPLGFYLGNMWRLRP